MEEQSTNPKSELWSLSLRDLFYKYVRFLPVFVLSVALALFGAYAYLRYATPIYSTTGTLIIKSERQGNRNDKFEDIFGGGKSQDIASEIEILKSKPLMQRVVKKLDLQFSYFAKGKIKTINVYKYGPFVVSSAQLKDSSLGFSFKIKFQDNNQFRINDEELLYSLDRPFTNSYGTFIFKKNPYGGGSEYVLKYASAEAMAAALAPGVQVQPKSAGAGILNLSIQSENPNLAADIINQLMLEYGDYTKELKNRTSDQTLAFIKERMDTLGRELEFAQQALLSYQQRSNIVDIEQQLGNYFSNITEADRAIQSQRLLLNDVSLLENFLSSKRNAYSTITSPLAVGDPTLGELSSGYNTAQLERQSLLESNVPATNPKVQELEAKIEQLREGLLMNLAAIRKSYTKTISDLRASGATSESQLRLLPYKAKEYAELKQAVENKKELYNILQAKREETAIGRAANIENSQIVEKAYVSGTPVKPNRRSIQIMAILIGIAIPALFVFAGEVLNDKVTTRFDIEKITKTPILGEVGHSYSDSVLVVNKTTRSMVAEQFRIIRSNLQYILGKNEKPCILVTSSFSGEGKSFVSTNTAAVLALADKKTVVLEFDIRKPKVLSGLNMAKRPGITNYLVGKSDNIDELVAPVQGHENLYVLACGPVPPNPSELLLGERVDKLFAELKQKFDVVVIDTAPVGMVSDAMTLAKYADCTFYLVRQGHTFKKQVAMIDEFYTENKLPKVSIVINDVKMKAGYGYYGYGRYGYGYGYGYGSYYEEEVAPKSFLEKMLGWMDVRKWFGKKKNK